MRGLTRSGVGALCLVSAEASGLLPVAVDSQGANTVYLALVPRPLWPFFLGENGNGVPHSQTLSLSPAAAVSNLTCRLNPMALVLALERAHPEIKGTQAGGKLWDG